MSQPFNIFPWDRPFLPDLQEYICAQCHNSLGKSVIIIPHNRPRRYLMDLFKNTPHLARPALLPRIITISEVVGLFRTQGHIPQQNAQLLDRIHMLYHCVQQLSKDSATQEISTHFSRMDLAQFLPWGRRLAALFEEYMTQLIPVQDILYVEGDVSAKAGALLGALSHIYQAYTQKLIQQKVTTPGFETLLAAQEWEETNMIPPALCARPEKNVHVFIAGLTALTQGEHVLLKALWKQGAHICLHSDPLMASDSTRATAHNACIDHAHWIRSWQATCTIPSVCHRAAERTPQSPKVSFFSGYDVHSQLLAVQERLQSLRTESMAGHEEKSTAIVLTSPNLLMPTLHHLPNENFNVSMGYPLDKSSIFGLIENILRIHSSAQHEIHEDSTCNEENKATNISPKYHWRPLLQCIRHPYIRMLKYTPKDAQENQESVGITSLLFRLESILREGMRFVQPSELMHTLALNIGVAENISKEHDPHHKESYMPLLEKVFTVLFFNFSKAHSAKSMAEAVYSVCELLLEYAYPLLERAPLDAESLYRLMQNVLPALKASSMADEKLPQSTLFALTRELMSAERVPFEADPLTGLQVLGMLETRLLHFTHVLVLDATDDTLPGFSSQDPLLPDALRQLIGLPSAQQRERVFAHTLYRLVASAKEVHFFWQEGSQRSALFDGKKSRSRFVDTFIWQEEQKSARIIESGTAPLYTAPCPVHPVQRRTIPIIRGAALQEKIHNLLRNGISPTALDAYLSCPQRFALQYLYKLRPLQEVNEGEDPALVGDILHAALHFLYKPMVHKDIQQGDISDLAVQNAWNECFNYEELQHKLPPDSLMMLRMAAPFRLKRFIQEQPKLTHILALEKKYTASINSTIEVQEGQGAQYTLQGIIDRIDYRYPPITIDGEDSQKKLFILDYKTGKTEKIPIKAWENQDLWQQIQTWTPKSQNSAMLLEDVASTFASLQLPCYIYLCKNNFTQSIYDAALVSLRDTGKELFLLGEKMDAETRDTIIQVRIPMLLQFVIQHIAHALEFVPREGTHCSYCPYGALCHK